MGLCFFGEVGSRLWCCKVCLSLGCGFSAQGCRGGFVMVCDGTLAVMGTSALGRVVVIWGSKVME